MICIGSLWDLSSLGTNPDFKMSECTTKLLILAETGSVPPTEAGIEENSDGNAPTSPRFKKRLEHFGKYERCRGQPKRKDAKLKIS